MATLARSHCLCPTATGYRPGGTGEQPGRVIHSFAPDTVTDYELARKARCSRTPDVDADVYYMDWKDVQLNSLLDEYRRG